jgi:hypothetical protein
MDFTRKKLPKEAALNLRICPIASVKPYALMLGPVYVFMRLNEKFVSVKGPLDFFTPEELERLKTFESFHLPEFVDQALPFRQVARHARSIVGWTPTEDGEEQLPPAPYELSDAVLRMLGPLWGPDAVIEPFFAAVFANELCDLLPDAVLVSAREQSVQAFERAVLRSGWAVFIALHLGYCELPFLNRLRRRVFEGSDLAPPSTGVASEIDELVAVVFDSMGADLRSPVRGSVFEEQGSRAGLKMAGRLKRVLTMIDATEPASTIFGERGFVDV